MYLMILPPFYRPKPIPALPNDRPVWIPSSEKWQQPSSTTFSLPSSPTPCIPTRRKTVPGTCISSRQALGPIHPDSLAWVTPFFLNYPPHHHSDNLRPLQTPTTLLPQLRQSQLPPVLPPVLLLLRSFLLMLCNETSTLFDRK